MTKLANKISNKLFDIDLLILLNQSNITLRERESVIYIHLFILCVHVFVFTFFFLINFIFFPNLQVKALDREIQDLQSEFELERTDYLETIRKHERQIQLHNQIFERLVPIISKDYNYR